MKYAYLSSIVICLLLFSCNGGSEEQSAEKDQKSPDKDHTEIVDSASADSNAVETPEKLQRYFAFGTGNLESSLDFYKKLGFEVLDESNKAPEGYLLSDGSFLFALYEGENGSFSYILDTEEPQKRLDALNEANISNTPKEMGGTTVYEVGNNDNLMNILILDENYNQERPELKNMLTIPIDNMRDTSNYPTAKGMFGELSLGVSNLEEAIEFWKQFDFEPKSVNKVPYPWAIMSDGYNIIGLHEREGYDAPAITYFAADMLKRIEALKKEGFTDMKPVPTMEQFEQYKILETPEGAKIFLFNL